MTRTRTLQTPRRLALGATGIGLALTVMSLAPMAPAGAATATSTATYTCTAPTGTTFELPADIALDQLPATLTAGVPVAAGTPFAFGLDPATLTTALGNTVLAGNYTVNQLTTGTDAEAVTNTVTNPVLTQLGTSLLGVTGTLGTFTPHTGSLGLPVPTSFSLAPAVSLPGVNGVTNCTLNNQTVTPTTTTTAPGGTGQGGAVTVTKQTAKIKAHQIRKTTRVLITVKNQTGRATGTITAKRHGKKIAKATLHGGTARLKLHKLTHGINRVNITYTGDLNTNPAHKKIKVTTSRR